MACGLVLRWMWRVGTTVEGRSWRVDGVETGTFVGGHIRIAAVHPYIYQRDRSGHAAAVRQRRKKHTLGVPLGQCGRGQTAGRPLGVVGASDSGDWRERASAASV
jgi:hypothetical protein